jgi:hypothetical protein
MPNIRVGYGSDFVVKDQKVGIGSDNPQATLDVAGDIRGNFNVSGVTRLTSYSGFKSQKQNVYKPSTIGFGTVGVGTQVSHYETETDYTEIGSVEKDLNYTTLSEDLIIDSGQIVNVNHTEMVGVTTTGEQDRHTHQSHLSVGSLENVSVQKHFSVPCGDINSRQENPIEGTVRFNDDLNTLEFFNGNEWRQFTYNQGQSGRGVISTGDNAGGNLTSIEVLNVSTLGNSVYFGDTTEARTNANGVSDGKRGCFGGGYQAPTTEMDTIDYITMASNGNAIDFGNLSAARNACGSAASSTRGLWMGGTGSPGNAIDTTDYIEIATVGNALDFGNLSTNRNFLCGLSNPTRAIAAGGRQPAYVATIEFFIIASKGDATDFGDLTEIRRTPAPATSSTRGVMSNGQTPNDTGLRTIDYITMASTGNAINFGDSTISIENRTGLTNTTRGVFAGGLDSPTRSNVIDYVTIASTGDAIDFGDLSVLRRAGGGASDSHGGLGGF